MAAKPKAVPDTSHAVSGTEEQQNPVGKDPGKVVNPDQGEDAAEKQDGEDELE
jgi:hypothetical protein